MRVLIVYAHPEPRSFCAALKDAAVATLGHAGHAVTVSDLYAMAFDPVAGPEDFGSRRDADYLVYALEQRHNFSAKTLAPDIRAEVEKVLAADFLLMIFPLFWFSVPAILKGWIDRVFLSGPFYGGRRIFDRGGLCGRRALVATTMGSHRAMFGDGAIHPPLSDITSHLWRGTLGYVGYQVLEPFYAYHVPYISDRERQTILADWSKSLDDLDSRPALTMPRLEEFDGTLSPVGRR